MIDQLHDFYQLHYPKRMKDPRDYKQVGQQMFEKYPSIKREGKSPWSALTRVLSCNYIVYY